MTIVGIDEAGKGPVIGPMVMAGVMISEGDEAKLVSLGVKDSKLLTRERREFLFDKIIRIAKSTRIIIIEPKEIDEILNSPNLNLNSLEAIKSALIVNEFKPKTVIVDCPSPNKQAYSDFLRMNLKNDEIEILSEHKADFKYPVVAAASILAKVTRDREMDKIKAKYGNVGPGYPSNEITKKFIEENWEKHPEIFRKTWATFKNKVKEKKQKKLVEF